MARAIRIISTGSRWFLVVAALSTVSPTHGAAVPQPPDQFTTVNGVRLHYLDWGGHGPVLLFLAGLGDSVHRFDALAPRFTVRYRALGFTRRGQEESEKPAAGYDLESLANDIRAFVDLQGIDRATLIGHSIAGAEMTRFAVMYPKRLTALVYLDAAYDYRRAYELASASGLAKPNRDAALEAISRAARVRPEYRRITAPALGFFVLYDAPIITSDMDAKARISAELAYRTLDGSGYKRAQIQLFRTTLQRSQVVEWHDTNHMFFNDPRHADDTVNVVSDFLARVAAKP